MLLYQIDSNLKGMYRIVSKVNNRDATGLDAYTANDQGRDAFYSDKVRLFFRVPLFKVKSIGK